ncbi:MAG: hypothetical protein P8I91_04210 [Phycisphaerales bacterium]|jgi:hypothetical protein|nr:hypothetical protein [Phycisphaerales bacterium]
MNDAHSQFDPPPSSGEWSASHEPFDPRCDELDAAMDAALDQTAPRHIPDGLAQRVAAASLPHLAQGRSSSSSRLRLVPNLSRLAMAACVVLALLAAFWVAGRQAEVGSEQELARDTTPRIVAPADVFGTSDAITRVRGLQAINDLDWQGAVGDLENVVWAVGNGAASRMVLSPGGTPMEAVENELDSVRVVARLES